jgi:hypothetical protein
MEFRAVLAHQDTGRIAATHVTLEYFPLGAHLDSAKGTGIHAAMTLGALILVKGYHLAHVWITVQGLGGAGLLARGRVAMATDGGLQDTLFSDLVDLYACQIGIDDTFMGQGAGQLT